MEYLTPAAFAEASSRLMARRIVPCVNARGDSPRLDADEIAVLARLYPQCCRVEVSGAWEVEVLCVCVCLLIIAGFQTQLFAILCDCHGCASQT